MVEEEEDEQDDAVEEGEEASEHLQFSSSVLRSFALSLFLSFSPSPLVQVARCKARAESVSTAGTEEPAEELPLELAHG